MRRPRRCPCPLRPGARHEQRLQPCGDRRARRGADGGTGPGLPHPARHPRRLATGGRPRPGGPGARGAGDRRLRGCRPEHRGRSRHLYGGGGAVRRVQRAAPCRGASAAAGAHQVRARLRRPGPRGCGLRPAYRAAVAAAAEHRAAGPRAVPLVGLPRARSGAGRAGLAGATARGADRPPGRHQLRQRAHAGHAGGRRAAGQHAGAVLAAGPSARPRAGRRGRAPRHANAVLWHAGRRLLLRALAGPARSG